MKKWFLLLIIVLLLTSCKPKTYTVTFYDGDKLLNSVEIKKGDNIKKLNTPTKEGYIFVNWLKDGLDYDKGTPITSDLILTAKWTEKPSLVKKYTVTFSVGDSQKTQSVEEGKLAQRPSQDPKMEKHAFIGWYVGEIEYDFNTPVTKDLIIVAKFQKNRINITYDLNGGTGSTVSVEIDKDTIPEKPKEPTKYGYNFINWTLDGKPYYFDFPLTNDTTIKAVWEATVYVKVTFDTDGGDNISSVMLSAGAKLTSLPTPKKEGYTFKEWTLNGEKFNINEPINDNITLVATYEQNEEANENNEEDN